MRLFVSVNVPPDVAARAAGLVPASAALRPVPAELMHLTLAFLGWTDDARAGEAAAAVAAGA
ncbi:MAG: 2'-5' RNA ligase family protein, partial [Candidatus Limnocylindria bacterium]